MKKFMKIFLPLMVILLITGCSSKKEGIVIYTSMEENRNQLLKEQIKDKFPDLDITVQYMSTGNSAAKIKNEGTSTEADIVIDLETAYMKSVENNFADLKDIDTSMYLDNVIKSNNYLPWVKYTMNIIIDKKYFKEHNLEVPKTYEDLLKPCYKNLIAMPDPKTSGTGYAFLLNVINLKGEDKTIEYFKKLKNNLREFSVSGSGPTNLLKQGEIAIALGMTSQGVEAINEGYDFEIVELNTGSPYNTTSCGIIKGREDKENVKEVFEWLISDFGTYDKEHFMPDKLLKNQESKMKNYPESLTDANMNNIDSEENKKAIIELWGKVNG